MAMKYDPIMCMMVDDTVKTKDEEYKMKVTSYVINKGQSGEYYGLKNKETNQVLYSAPNNWKSREGAKRWAEKKGMIYVEDSNTLDKAIKMCDYAYGTAEIKDVNGKWVVYHSGRYVQEFDNSDDAEAFVREKGWH